MGLFEFPFLALGGKALDPVNFPLVLFSNGVLNLWSSMIVHILTKGFSSVFLLKIRAFRSVHFSPEPWKSLRRAKCIHLVSWAVFIPYMSFLSPRTNMLVWLKWAQQRQLWSKVFPTSLIGNMNNLWQNPTLSANQYKPTQMEQLMIHRAEV